MQQFIESISISEHSRHDNMEVDRLEDWKAETMLRPKYQAVPVSEKQENAPEKKRRSIFGKKNKKSGADTPVMVELKKQEDTLEMESFFIQHATIRKRLHKLHLLQDQLEINNRIQTASTDEQDLEKCDMIAETLSQEMTKTSALIRGELSELRSENERLAPTAPTGSGYLRIRQVQHGALLRQFTTAMAAFQAAQRSGTQQVKDTIKRQFQIVNPEADENDLDAVCDPTASLMLRSQVFGLASRDGAQRVMERMQARRQSMLKVEEGIAAISQLYNDMYGLLEEQQANLDSLETFINGTVDYLEDATSHMDTAVEHQKNIRKMKCSIF